MTYPEPMYTKLASAIIFSTIWQESGPTRLVWISMLAMKNRHGEVTATVPGLAHAARVTVEECEEAIRILSSPDTHSSDFGSPTRGRRVERTKDGWWVINHEKYQRLANEEEKQEKDAERQRRKRKRDNPKSHAVSDHTDTDTSSDPDPESDPEGERLAAPVAPKRKRRTLWHSVPEGWEPNEKHRARTRHWPPGSFERELEAYRNHEFAVGKSDPDKTFTGWLLRHEKTAKLPPPPKPKAKMGVDW